MRRPNRYFVKIQTLVPWQTTFWQYIIIHGLNWCAMMQNYTNKCKNEQIYRQTDMPAPFRRNSTRWFEAKRAHSKCCHFQSCYGSAAPKFTIMPPWCLWKQHQLVVFEKRLMAVDEMVTTAQNDITQRLVFPSSFHGRDWRRTLSALIFEFRSRSKMTSDICHQICGETYHNYWLRQRI